MDRFTLIAINLLPELAKRLATGDDGAAERVSDLVKPTLGTLDPDKARSLLDEPRKTAELRIRLADALAEAEARTAPT